MLKLSDLLPHRPPMVLLNDFMHADAENVSCRVDIGTNSPFFDATLQGVPAYVGIEYMAQTIAAYSGAQSQRLGQQPKVGFLLGTRKYHAQVGYFKLDQQLEVQATKVIEDSSGLSVFNCEIIDTESSQIIVRAKLNVFQPDDVTNWLQEKV